MGVVGVAIIVVGFVSLGQPAPQRCHIIEEGKVVWEDRDIGVELGDRGYDAYDGLTMRAKLTNGSYSDSMRKSEDDVYVSVDSPVKKIEIGSSSCSTNIIGLESTSMCPDGLSFVNVSRVSQRTVDTEGMDGFCIFQYEASRKDASSARSGREDVAVSRKGVVPWTIVNQSEADHACKRGGYRLVSNKEWQAATMAVPGDESTFVRGNNDEGRAVDNRSETCRSDPTSDGRCLTGTGPSAWCTGDGICDLNGNVWERVDGFYGQGSICDHGAHAFVDEWNSSEPCPASVADSPSDRFDSDGYWYPDDTRNTTDPDNNGYGALIRGGDFDNRRTSGVWALGLGTDPSTRSPVIGFRCSWG